MTHFHSFRSSIVWFCCCCCSVTQSCLTLCDPHGLQHARVFVFHHLPELAQTHVHWFGDTIQPSRPLLFPYSPAFSLSQHQGLFQWVSSLHQVDKVLGVSASVSVLPMNIRGWFPSGLIDLISLLTSGDSQESSPTPQFKSIDSSAFSFLYRPTLTSIRDYWKNHSFD